MSANTEQTSIAKKCIESTPDDCVTKDMRMLLQNLANLANQASDCLLYTSKQRRLRIRNNRKF